MIKNYFKIAVRNLRKQKLYSLINILGLAVGLAFCVLVLLFINDELTYDRFHADSDRIYRLFRQPVAEDSPLNLELNMPFPAGEAMKNDFPAVEEYVRFAPFGTQNIRHGGVIYEQDNVVFADPAMFSVFTFPLQWGDPSTTLVNPNSAVLAPEAAGKYFGNENPIGRTLSIRLNGEYRDFTVTGVTEPVPSNSTIQFQVLLPMRTLLNTFDVYGRVEHRWDATRVITYVRLREGFDVNQVRARLPEFMNNHLGDMFDEMRKEGTLKAEGPSTIYQLQPLLDVHLNPDIPGGFSTPSDPVYSYNLGGIALAVLLIACINFMILAIGRSSRRMKEVGMRKVAGADRMQLMVQFWGEAMLLTFIAFAIGIGLAEAFLPVFNDLAGKELQLATLLQYPSVLGILAGIFLLTGLAAGCYPALVLSGFQPIDSLKEQLSIGGANLFTRSLIVVQFALSIFLVSGTLIMSNQLEYMREKNLGFQGEQVVVIPLPGLEGERVLDIYRNELSAERNIQSISAISFVFDRGTARRGFQYEGELKQVAIFRVEPNFIGTMDMELLQGRDFNPELASDSTQSIIVNEAFVREFGWSEDPLSRALPIEWGSLINPKAIGVVRDFHFQSLENRIQPAMLYMNPLEPIRNLMIRIGPDNMTASIDRLRSVWGQVTNEVPFSYRFLDDGMDQLYQEEERWSKIIAYGSFFAIFIAALGLFGLAGITAVRRQKEIGIRKVFGATITGILALLSRDFVRLVLIAILIAAPVAYYIMQQWLEDFAYRIEIGLGVFLLAGLAALTIAVVTVSWHALKTARMNPVESLRSE